MRVTYEESDIDIENNPLHDFLDKQLLVSNMSFVLLNMGRKKYEGAISEEEKEFNRKNAAVNIAAFLNGMEKDGWEIVKKETSIPSVYREGFVAKD
jgi:hypothetical protein